MSTTATSGLYRPTWRRRSSASPACETTSKPDSVSSRATPSRSRTESSASATRIEVPTVELVFRRGGKSCGRSLASSWWMCSGWGSRSSCCCPRSRAATPSSGHGRRRGQDLPSVPRVRDSGRAYEVDAGVPLHADRRRARVEADADAHSQELRPVVVAHRALRLEGGAHGPTRVREAASHSSPTASISWPALASTAWRRMLRMRPMTTG